MSTPSEELRARLGERIPEGGTEEDTMFSNAEILDLLSYGDRAEEEGWRRKAAEFASLVDTAEGTARRAMSDLHAHALRQMELAKTEQPTAKRTRSHRLSRGVE